MIGFQERETERARVCDCIRERQTGGNGREAPELLLGSLCLPLFSCPSFLCHLVFVFFFFFLVLIFLFFLIFYYFFFFFFFFFLILKKKI
jgi:hypothetical protein